MKPLAHLLSICSLSSFCLMASGAWPPQEEPKPLVSKRVDLDPTPSDPAAIGFLTGVVDQCIYSPENDGLTKIEVKAKIHWLGAKSTVPDFSVDMAVDFSKGETQINWPTHIEKQYWASLEEPVLSVLHLTMRPSREATNFIASLQHEEAEIRVDFKPRQKEEFLPWTCWYSQDGLPLRATRETKNPLAENLRFAFDVDFAYSTIAAHRVRTGRTDKNAQGKLETRYEYQLQDGYLLLKKVTLLSEGVGIAIEYDSYKLTPPAASKPTKPKS